MRKVYYILLVCIAYAIFFTGCSGPNVVAVPSVAPNTPAVLATSAPAPAPVNSPFDDPAPSPVIKTIDEIDVAAFNASPALVLVESLPEALKTLYTSVMSTSSSVEHILKQNDNGTYSRIYEITFYGDIDKDKLKAQLDSVGADKIEIKSDDLTQSVILSYTDTKDGNAVSVLLDNTLPEDSLPKIPQVLVETPPVIRSVYISSADSKKRFSRTWILGEADYHSVAQYYMPIMNNAKNSEIENINDTDTRLSGEFADYKLVIDFIFANNKYLVEMDISAL